MSLPLWHHCWPRLFSDKNEGLASFFVTCACCHALYTPGSVSSVLLTTQAKTNNSVHGNPLAPSALQLSHVLRVTMLFSPRWRAASFGASASDACPPISSTLCKWMFAKFLLLASRAVYAAGNVGQVRWQLFNSPIGTAFFLLLTCRERCCRTNISTQYLLAPAFALHSYAVLSFSLSLSVYLSIWQFWQIGRHRIATIASRTVKLTPSLHIFPGNLAYAASWGQGLMISDNKGITTILPPFRGIVN